MNDYVYKGSDFRVILDTGIDISTATFAIIYRKPNSTTEHTLVATALDTTSIYVDIQDTVNDTAGKWLFRAHVFIATKEYYGEPAIIEVKDTWDPFT